jgi:hypothetical protein
VRALQGAGAVRGDPGRVRQCGEHGPDDPHARPDPAPPGQLPPHRRGEPVQAQPPDPAQIPGAPDPAPRPATRTSSPAGTGSVTRPAPQATRTPADPGSGSPPPSPRWSAGCGAPPGAATAPTPRWPAPARNSAAHWPAARSAPRPSGPTCPGSGPPPHAPGRPSSGCTHTSASPRPAAS